MITINATAFVPPIVPPAYSTLPVGTPFRTSAGLFGVKMTTGQAYMFADSAPVSIVPESPVTVVAATIIITNAA